MIQVSWWQLVVAVLVILFLLYQAIKQGIKIAGGHSFSVSQRLELRRCHPNAYKGRYSLWQRFLDLIFYRY